MWNIIRAQFASIKRDRIVMGIGVLVLFIGGVLWFDTVTETEGVVTGSLVTGTVGAQICIAGLLFLLTLTADVMGNDFVDKTINYEILAGHSRKEVYFGRAITAMVLGIVITGFLSVFYPGIMTIQNGWGDDLELKRTMARYGLFLLLCFRIVCELSFLTVVLKNIYLVYLVGFIFGYVQFLLQIMLELEDSWFFAVGSCFYLFGLENPAAGITAVSSIVIGCLFLMLGYLYFRQNDLH